MRRRRQTSLQKLWALSVGDRGARPWVRLPAENLDAVFVTDSKHI